MKKEKIMIELMIIGIVLVSGYLIVSIFTEERYEILHYGDLHYNIINHDDCVEVDGFEDCDVMIKFGYDVVCTDPECIGGRYSKKMDVGIVKFDDVDRIIESCYNDRECEINNKKFVFSYRNGFLGLLK